MMNRKVDKLEASDVDDPLLRQSSAIFPLLVRSQQRPDDNDDDDDDTYGVKVGLTGVRAVVYEYRGEDGAIIRQWRETFLGAMLRLGMLAETATLANAESIAYMIFPALRGFVNLLDSVADSKSQQLLRLDGVFLALLDLNAEGGDVNFICFELARGLPNVAATMLTIGFRAIWSARRAVWGKQRLGICDIGTIFSKTIDPALHFDSTEPLLPIGQFRHFNHWPLPPLRMQKEQRPTESDASTAVEWDDL